MQVQPHPVMVEPPAGQPRPAQGVVSLLDVPPGGAAPVAEPYHPVGLHGQIGDDKADLREQIARMALDPGDDTAGRVP